MPETLKVLSGVVIKLISEGVQVCQAIPHNRTALGIKTIEAVEVVDDTTTNHCIERHQGPLLLTGETRPPFQLVGFPEREDHITGHLAYSSDLAGYERLIHPNAWNNSVASVQRPSPQKR